MQFETRSSSTMSKDFFLLIKIKKFSNFVRETHKIVIYFYKYVILYKLCWNPNGYIAHEVRSCSKIIMKLSKVIESVNNNGKATGCTQHTQKQQI